MKPRVSCVMITARRRHFVPRAIACFLAQTYENRELVIFDNGETPVADLVPRSDDRRIRYYYRHFDGERTIGALRNSAVDVTNGDYIAHWDDDDWSAPSRLDHQVSLIGDSPIAGYHSLLFWDEFDEEPRLWKFSGAPGTALGTSLFYSRWFWRHHQFADITHGEDNAFQLEAPGQVKTADGIKPLRMIARMHEMSSERHIHETIRRRFELDPTSVENWTVIAHKPTILQAQELLQ